MDSHTSVWNYYYDQDFTNPLNMIVNNKPQPEVRLDADNIRPISGSFDDLNEALAEKIQGAKHIHIYTVRHGNATHNAQSERYSKPITWRFLAGLRANFDPGLTERGVGEAQLAGNMLRGLMRDEGAPRPVRVYTSPLKRCIQTSMLLIRELRLPRRLGGPGAELRVREGLREWKGYGHDHQSDRRGTASDIQALVDGLNESMAMDVQLNIDPFLLQPAQQQTREDRLGEFGLETYTDVDVRVRKVLDDIFEAEQSGKSVIVVLHNRSNKSLLRIMGFIESDVHTFDLENCAILPYLVRRTRMSPFDMAQRRRIEQEGSDQWDEDLNTALAEKDYQHQLAAQEVKRLSAENFQNLVDFLVKQLEGGDEWARHALEDLCMCRN